MFRLWRLLAPILVFTACLDVHAAAVTTSNVRATGAAAAAHAAGLARFVVGFDEQHKQQIKHQLQFQGYSVISEGPGFFAVSHPTAPSLTLHEPLHAAERGTPTDTPSSSVGTSHRRKMLQQAARAAHTRHVAHLSSLPGVHSSEQDVRRFLHILPAQQQGDSSSARHLTAVKTPKATADARTATHGLSGQKLNTLQHARGKPYEAWGSEVVDAMCASKDVNLNPEKPGGEVIPWGIKEIGANNDILQGLPPKGRTIVCIIDSGLYRAHEEYAGPTPRTTGLVTMSGCQTSGSCPFQWSDDLVGHGTHVSGTIGAPLNGYGVVGVIHQGAEIHMVRVWNDTGDVSQGQGPYATDLVLAYNHCLNHLKSEQEKSGGKKVSMVINMSFGSAGPLTVERMWVEKAAKRGDILFVGSAGNNGSWLDIGKPRSAGAASLGGSEPVGQYLSYPASYKLDEVLSVANARCDLSIEYTSQKNKQVSIAAPGMAILSTVPSEYGTVRAHITTDPSVAAAGGKGANKGNTIGYLANGYKEPRPIQGTRWGSTPRLPLAVCSIKDDQRIKPLFRNSDSACPSAKDSICLIELPGNQDTHGETCAAMLKCVKGGGQGLIVYRQDKLAGNNADSNYDFMPLEVLIGTQVDCGSKCRCWKDLKATLGCSDAFSCTGKAPPGIVISAKHAAALLAAGAAKGSVKASIANYQYNYRYLDGTSMAAPHVTGAAALLWRLFPECKAADIATALKMSAQKLPGQKSVPDYAAGHGMLKVDKAYEWIKKNNPCAQ